MSAASPGDRAWACFSTFRLTGWPVPPFQYDPIVLTMVGTLAASTSRKFSSADASLSICSGLTPTSSLSLLTPFP